MALLTRNTKIKKSSGDRYKVYNFTLPAIKTCPFADKCKTGCYANQGAYKWSNVSLKHHANWTATKHINFVATMSAEIKAIRLKSNQKAVIRIHDAGDFYNAEYLQKWVDIANLNKDALFYAYTKSVPYFDNIQLPPNFRVIFSEGGKFDSLIGDKRHARVFSSDSELRAAGYTSAMENDLVAPLVRSGKVGLVYHGAKSKTWTTK